MRSDLAKRIGHQRLDQGSMALDAELTVRPFFNVVVSVLTGRDTGVAKPRRNGAERAARPRRPWLRLRASLRDAIAVLRWTNLGMSGL